VVIGNGMVGVRFAEEARRHDPVARALAITVLGAEHRAGYNRVLLPNLLSGTMQDEDLVQYGAGAGLQSEHAILLRTGTAAIRINLAEQTVTTSDGDMVRYDHLVLATGATARVPAITGIRGREGEGTSARAGEVARARMDGGGRGPGAPGKAPTRAAQEDGWDAGQLPRDVTALRTIADAHRLMTLAATARRKHGRIAVLGGGVLGLEAARALAARGTAVTVVHQAGHLMDRQLDVPAGRVLAGALRAMGVEVRLGVQAIRWEPGRGLWLDGMAPDGGDRSRAGLDGAGRAAARAAAELLPCCGLLLSAGTIPETGLAAAAGLRLTPSGTVAIDDALTTSDPRVHAIGDCAGHPGAAGSRPPCWPAGSPEPSLARAIAGRPQSPGSRPPGST